ncbi:ABC transporter permease [Candidatus Leptofilum sp.]|uniref:ABC transporter permease n=1 Tax=Candidatus Leptofilum sp. TaxID=3241576 RepID=UPI003B5CB5A0
MNLKPAPVFQPFLAVILSLMLGLLIVLPTGENPLEAYRLWFSAGFGCAGSGGFCAIWTSLQYATPMILSGLAAMVAFRSGMISIGQFGQMVCGAGATTFLVVTLPGAPWLRMSVGLLGGVIAGGIWSAIPGALRAYLNINEVITTLIFNTLALAATGSVSFWRIPQEVRFTPLIPTTKLTVAFFIAIGVAVLVYLYLWRRGKGLEVRMAGQASLFAKFAGMNARWAVVRGMFISGGLAGLAGGLEVLAVHHRFVSSFSTIDQFDGIIVSLLGQLHPLGIVFSSFLLGGLRLGSLNGLQLQTAVPRQLSNIIIGLMMILMVMPTISYWLRARTKTKGA